MRARVVTQDLRDLENVRDVTHVEVLAEMLRTRVGGPISIKSLQEDLQVSPNTVEHWIQILERLYYCYRITPFGVKRAKAVKKAKKLYLWDWAAAENPGAKFENLVAGHLLKYCHFLEDTEGFQMELRYLKDVEGREGDFVVVKENVPIFMVECKTGERSLSPRLSYYQERLSIPKAYQVHLGTADFGNEAKGGRVLPFLKFAKLLELK